MADSDPHVELADTEPVICIPDPEPEPILTGGPSNVIYPLFSGSGGSGASDPYVQQLLADKEYCEMRLLQMENQRDDLERKLERERRERQTLYFKYTQEVEEKKFCEDRINNLTRTISRCEEELRSIRTENSRLKTQFTELRTLIDSRSTTSEVHHHHVVGYPTSGTRGDFNISFPDHHDGDTSYKDEVVALAHENKIFSQLIDILDSRETVVKTEKHVEERYSYKEDFIRLEQEKTKLEDRVHELEKNLRNQCRLLENVTADYEEEVKLLNNNLRRLEDRLRDKCNQVEDYERQIGHIRRECAEELRQIQFKFESDSSSKVQLEEHIHVLESSIRNLEMERKEMVVKIDHAYKTENEIINQRNILEEHYHNQLNECRIRLDEEEQRKVEFTQEINRLMGEVLELRNLLKQAEDTNIDNLEELKARFEKEREDIIRFYETGNNVMVCPQPGQIAVDNTVWQDKLESEKKKREKTEQENKKLLYRINKMLRKTDVDVDIDIDLERRDECSKDYSDTVSRSKVRELEEEIYRLKNKCERLERDAKKRRDLENKNRELQEEVDSLISKRDEMVRKQRDLIKEIENLTNTFRGVEDKNRALVIEIDNMSRKIRDMEDAFRREKEEIIRKLEREKKNEVDAIQKDKETLERKVEELTRNNRNAENTIRDLEYELKDLKNQLDRANREKSEIIERFTKEINNEKSRADSLKQDLDRQNEAIRRQKDDFDNKLREITRNYEEEVKKLENEKRQMRNDFDREKDNMRQRFEEEKRDLERRIRDYEDRLRRTSESHVQSGGTDIRIEDKTYVSGGKGGLDLRHKFEMEKTEIERKFIAEKTNMQQEFDRLMQQERDRYSGTLADLQQQVRDLRNTKNELEDKIRDMERKFDREKNDMIYEFTQEKRKIIAQMEEDLRRKTDDVRREWENRMDDLVRKFEKEKDELIDKLKEIGIKRPCRGDDGDLLERKLKETLEALKDTRERLRDLEKEHVQLKTQFASEKRAIILKYNQDRNELLRKIENEKKQLAVTIHNLKRELQCVKQERDNLLDKYRREKRNNQTNTTTIKQDITKIEIEYNDKMKIERENSQKVINELRRKLNAAEDALRASDMKLREYTQEMDFKIDQEKMQFEVNLKRVEETIRTKIEAEYEIKLKEQKEYSEQALRGLRKEITCLQEQRRQIQLKLTNQDITKISKVFIDKNITSTTSSQDVLSGRFQQDYDKLVRENKDLEDKTRNLEKKIRDFEKEIDDLKREKNDIKNDYRQEKQQLQLDFERERKRVEDRYLKEVDELRCRLDEQWKKAISEVKENLVSSLDGRSSKHFVKQLREKVTSLTDDVLRYKCKNEELESELRYYKHTVDDLESRVRQLIFETGSGRVKLGDDDCYGSKGDRLGIGVDRPGRDRYGADGNRGGPGGRYGSSGDRFGLDGDRRGGKYGPDNYDKYGGNYGPFGGRSGDYGSGGREGFDGPSGAGGPGSPFGPGSGDRRGGKYDPDRYDKYGGKYGPLRGRSGDYGPSGPAGFGGGSLEGPFGTGSWGQTLNLRRTRSLGDISQYGQGGLGGLGGYPDGLGGLGVGYPAGYGALLGSGPIGGLGSLGGFGALGGRGGAGGLAGLGALGGTIGIPGGIGRSGVAGVGAASGVGGVGIGGLSSTEGVYTLKQGNVGQHGTTASSGAIPGASLTGVGGGGICSQPSGHPGPQGNAGGTGGISGVGPTGGTGGPGAGGTGRFAAGTLGGQGGTGGLRSSSVGRSTYNTTGAGGAGGFGPGFGGGTGGGASVGNNYAPYFSGRAAAWSGSMGGGSYNDRGRSFSSFGGNRFLSAYDRYLMGIPRSNMEIPWLRSCGIVSAPMMPYVQTWPAYQGSYMPPTNLLVASPHLAKIPQCPSSSSSSSSSSSDEAPRKKKDKSKNKPKEGGNKPEAQEPPPPEAEAENPPETPRPEEKPAAPGGEKEAAEP